MDNELNRFKKIMRGIRGNRSVWEMKKKCNLASQGSWQALEKNGNPQLLTLLKLSKELNLIITINNGNYEIH